MGSKRTDLRGVRHTMEFSLGDRDDSNYFHMNSFRLLFSDSGHLSRLEAFDLVPKEDLEWVLKHINTMESPS